MCARGRPCLGNGRGRGTVEKEGCSPRGLGVADRCEDEQLAVLGHRYSADGQGSETLISLAFFGWENGVGVVGVDRREVAVLGHGLVEPRIDSGQNARVPG